VIDSVYIAWRYLVFNKARSATLVACVSLIAVLPFTLEVLLDESERQLLSRAETTPLLVGAKGSALDLVMNSLYLDDQVPELVSMRVSKEVSESGLANPIPLYVRFRARGFPIVGTTLDYFDFRGLQVREGRSLALLGECVLGSAVADSLGLKPGDRVLSSPETVFDLAGIYPLNMKVVGVLERSHSADDVAVFVDVKTAWVIEGLVHGHKDLLKVRDPTLIMERTDDNVTATAKLTQYTEIDEQNIGSFHFHGEPQVYPLTAVIALPADAKSATILRGRYVSAEKTTQIVEPTEVIDGLLRNIFRVKSIIDSVIVVVGLAALLALVLVFALSLRLRQRELNTVFRLGCSRYTIMRLLGAEVAIILVASAALVASVAGVVSHYDEQLVRLFLVN
jgi:putative ABC transport system permease protein